MTTQEQIGDHQRAEGEASNAFGLGPLIVPRAVDVLTAELRERILGGQLKAGASLPPERDLVLQTKMSRTTVRQALKALEVQGLLQIRAGRGGGAFVQRPDNEGVINSVDVFVRGRNVRYATLLETREAIEPKCSALAADRHTDADLARLDAANEEMAAAEADLPKFLEANVRWHVAVADASHNELLSAFMHAIARTIYSTTEEEDFTDSAVREMTLRAHRKTTDAIRRHDAAEAARRMERHISVGWLSGLIGEEGS